MEPTQVLLIRSKRLGWSAIRSTLASLPGVTMLDEVTDPERGWHLIVTHHPDIAFVDAEHCCKAAQQGSQNFYQALRTSTRLISLGDDGGPEASARLAAIGPVSQIAWSDLDDDSMSSYLLAVLEGNMLLYSRSVAKEIVLVWRRASGWHDGLVTDVREQAILDLLFEGLTHAEIARRLCISRQTVTRTIAELKDRWQTTTLFGLGSEYTKHKLLGAPTLP